MLEPCRILHARAPEAVVVEAAKTRTPTVGATDEDFAYMEEHFANLWESGNAPLQATAGWFDRQIDLA
jgi:hypothetical protein